MRLERHVGGLSVARKEGYLRTRRWTEDGAGWTHALHGTHPLAKALHHQLTSDLSEALCGLGWRVRGYSKRGYVQLAEGKTGEGCSLPRALRIQARREGRKVGELTYSLFLAAVLAI